MLFNSRLFPIYCFGDILTFARFFSVEVLSIFVLEHFAMKTVKHVAILLSCFLTSLAFADTVHLRILKTDKSTEPRNITLSKMEDGAMRLKIAVSEIPENTQHIDVVHEFFTAKKGEEGFWIFGRGVYGTFSQDNDIFSLTNIHIPLMGIKTPRGTYVGIIKGLRHEITMRVSVRNGKYSIFPCFTINKIPDRKAYEDIVIDFYKLEGDDANYSAMGRLYRKYQLENGKCKTLKERIKTRPELDYLCDALQVRIQYHAAKQKPTAGKKEHYTPEDEPPMKVYLSFADSIKFVKAIKDAGVDKVAFCSAGWQSGGYDGRFPDIFPIDKEIGGEDGLKKFIQEVKDMGYQISAHTNSTDCYSCSRLWDKDMVCIKHDGTLAKNGIWCGGRAYNLCLKYAWDRFLPKQLEDIAKLGFSGSHYVDVFSCIAPYDCFHPKHKINKKQAGEIQLEIADKCIELFGGFSSEGGYDHIIGKLDYCNYVANYMKLVGKKRLIEDIKPLWEIVYHGIVLSNPDRYTQQDITADWRKILKLMEFGGRPIIYTNKFEKIPAIAGLYEIFKPVRHLQKELIHSHGELAKGITITKYENGEEIICNYNNTAYLYKGKVVLPKNYLLYKGK